MTIISEARLTRDRFTVLALQSRERTAHAASQARMAAVVTPERGPVGSQMVNRCARGAIASPARANTPNVKQPVAAANTAAAPGPLAGMEVSLVMRAYLHQDDGFAAAQSIAGE